MLLMCAFAMDQFWKLFLYGLFLIYPSVSSTVLRHFVCKQIDDRSYLWSDLRIQCYTDRWTSFSFVSIALILLYPIGIPVFFFALLKLNQKDLNQPRIKVRNRAAAICLPGPRSLCP